MQGQTAQDPLEVFSKFADSVSIWVGRLMALLTIVLVFLIVFEVVLRYCFNAPTVWGTELQTYMYGALCMFCIPYATYTQSHARVDIFLKRFSPKTQLWLEVLYIAIFFFPFMLVLAYFEAKVAYHSWEIREYSVLGAWQPPLYPVRAIIPIGAVLVLLQMLSELCKVLGKLRGEGRS